MFKIKQSSNIQNEIKVIMIGKSGNGKSSTGNTLLGYKDFTVARSLNAVTEQCHMETRFLRNGQRIKVVDTPGLFDAGNTLGGRALEILKAVEKCPNPNAFLLVLNPSRFTEEELCTVEVIRIIFGKEIFEHMCIVFTHGSEFQDREEFRKFWEESEYVRDLVKRCNGRVFKIENKNQNRYEDEDFLNLIDTIQSCPEYKYRYLGEHQAALKEHQDKYTSENKDIKSQIEDLDVRLSRRIDPKIWKERLITGVAIVGSVAATGVAVFVAPKAVAKTALGLGCGFVGYSMNKLSK
ncbi:GTPase IMAP family member 9-like [Ruditapes philippinarum]|uniref:GTPase IMAP family member 9-like n=1 Tax=Ruditapes philippinarum TaxID=129788 RepID=UPI00295B8CBF|nr:GTPase IMAP family member 9-like [Ruditapes philippinarum]